MSRIFGKVCQNGILVRDFDTETHPGAVIEISGISGSKGAFFERIRQAAANWDGSRPTRPAR